MIIRKMTMEDYDAVFQLWRGIEELPCAGWMHRQALPSSGTKHNTNFVAE